MKLVRKDDHSVEIVGTADTVLCRANIVGGSLSDDGVIDVVWEGGTDIFWDTQETTNDVVNGKDVRQFYDANGEIVLETDIELIDDEEDDDDAEV